MARRAKPAPSPSAGQTAADPARDEARRGKAGRRTSFAATGAPGPWPRSRIGSAQGTAVGALIDTARDTLLGDAW